MASALLVLLLAFGVLFLARIGGARRALWVKSWPALALGAGALFSVLRGGWSVGLVLAALALVAWQAPLFWIRRGAQRSPPAPDRTDADARAVLGVSATATEDEIRRAYREKMANAHPDRGGAHDQAARLTAARDHLLKRRKA